MTWRGDKTLSITFWLFLYLAAVFIGGVGPVLGEILGPGIKAGGKYPFVQSWNDFIPQITIYPVIALVF